jgi:hypothetical protein
MIERIIIIQTDDPISVVNSVHILIEGLVLVVYPTYPSQLERILALCGPV